MLSGGRSFDGGQEIDSVSRGLQEKIKNETDFSNKLDCAMILLALLIMILIEFGKHIKFKNF